MLGGGGAWWSEGNREGESILVLIPLLIAPIFVAIGVFVFVGKSVDHGRSDWVLGAIIGMTPAAMPLKSSCYLFRSGSWCCWPVRTLTRGRIVAN